MTGIGITLVEMLYNIYILTFSSSQFNSTKCKLSMLDLALGTINLLLLAKYIQLLSLNPIMIQLMLWASVIVSGLSIGLRFLSQYTSKSKSFTSLGKNEILEYMKKEYFNVIQEVKQEKGDYD